MATTKSRSSSINNRSFTRLKHPRIGLGLKSAGASALESEDWYIPYNGPYELPSPGFQSRPLRDSWGDVIGQYSSQPQPQLAIVTQNPAFERSSRSRHRALSSSSSHHTTSSRPESSRQKQPPSSFMDSNSVGIGLTPLPVQRSTMSATSGRGSLASFFTFGLSSGSGRKNASASPSQTTISSSPRLPKSAPLQGETTSTLPSSFRQSHNATATPFPIDNDYYNSYYGTLLSTRSAPPLLHPYAYTFPAPASSNSNAPSTPIDFPDLATLSPPPNQTQTASGVLPRVTLTTPPYHHHHHHSTSHASPPAVQRLASPTPSSAQRLKASSSTPNLRGMHPAGGIFRVRDRWLAAETWCDAVFFPRPRFRSKDGQKQSHQILGSSSGLNVSPPGSPLMDNGKKRESGLESRVLAYSRSVDGLRANGNEVLGAGSAIDLQNSEAGPSKYNSRARGDPPENRSMNGMKMAKSADGFPIPGLAKRPSTSDCVMRVDKGKQKAGDFEDVQIAKETEQGKLTWTKAIHNHSIWDGKSKGWALDDLALPPSPASLSRVIKEGESLDRERSKWRNIATNSFQNKRTRSVSKKQNRFRSLSNPHPQPYSHTPSNSLSASRSRSTSHSQPRILPQSQPLSAGSSSGSMAYLAQRTMLGNQASPAQVGMRKKPSVVTMRSQHSHSHSHSVENPGTQSHPHSKSLSNLTRTISRSGHRHSRSHSNSNSNSRSNGGSRPNTASSRTSNKDKDKEHHRGDLWSSLTMKAGGVFCGSGVEQQEQKRQPPGHPSERATNLARLAPEKPGVAPPAFATDGNRILTIGLGAPHTLSPVPSISDDPVGLAISTQTPTPTRERYEEGKGEDVGLKRHPYAQTETVSPARAPAVRRTGDYAGPHPSTSSSRQAGPELASPSPETEMAARHRLPPHATLMAHPYSAQALGASAATRLEEGINNGMREISPGKTMWAQVPPGVLREVLPVELRYSPYFDAERETPRGDDRTGVSVGEALVDMRNRAGNSPLAVETPRLSLPQRVQNRNVEVDKLDGVSPQARKRGPEHSGPGIQPQQHRQLPQRLSMMNHATSQSSEPLSSNHTLSSSPFEHLHHLHRYPFPPALTALRNLSHSSRSTTSKSGQGPESIISPDGESLPSLPSQSSSPPHSPRNLDASDDFDRFKDLFYRPQSELDEIEESDQLGGGELTLNLIEPNVPWDATAGDHRRTGSASTTLARQVQLDLVELTQRGGNSDTFERLQGQREGGLGGRRPLDMDGPASPALRFVLSEVTEKDPQKVGSEVDPGGKADGEGAYERSRGKDVESSRTSSLLEGISLLPGPSSELFRVGLIEACSTPPTTFVGDHRRSAQLSVVDPDEDVNVLDETEDVTVTQQTHLRPQPKVKRDSVKLLSIPTSFPDGARVVSYSTSTSGGSRMSGLSDFPAPPTEVMNMPAHMVVLDSYIDEMAIRTEDSMQQQPRHPQREGRGEQEPSPPKSAPPNSDLRRMTFGGDENIEDVMKLFAPRV